MKRLTALFLTLLLLLSLSACGNSAQNPSGSAGNNNSQGEDPSEAENPEDAEAGFPFTLTTKDGAEVTFTHVPETVLCTNVNTGDQLMALGLGDKIIATANNNTQVAPEFREEYEAIPEMADRPTLETILDMEPDFVYGRSSAFSEKYNTEHDTLSQYGIMSLSSIEGYKLGADLEDVYQDFYNLGRIFRVEDKAEEIVSAMKEQVAAVEEAVAGQESTKVFVIEHAGGTNIFNDLDTTWATVSWEEVVERAPEVIVIDDYGDTSLEEKIAFLKENPALATIPAVQNDRIISVTLCESFASSMTGDTVEKFARAFHPDCFE